MLMKLCLVFVSIQLVFSRPQISYKDGNVGVNFGGYHAEAGLNGGLHASAGTPFGQFAGAGLGRDGGFATATAGGGIGASAGFDRRGAGAEAHTPGHRRSVVKSTQTYTPIRTEAYVDEPHYETEIVEEVHHVPVTQQRVVTHVSQPQTVIINKDFGHHHSHTHSHSHRSSHHGHHSHHGHPLHIIHKREAAGIGITKNVNFKFSPAALIALNKLLTDGITINKNVNVG